MRKVRASLPLLVLALTACGDDPVEPDSIPLRDPLVEALADEGLAASRVTELPGGPGQVVGPEGVLLEVVAKEFVQRVTLETGPGAEVLLRTSGVSLVGVPVSDSPTFDRWRTGAAHTGSLESVTVGRTYEMVSFDDLQIDFIEEIQFGHGTLRSPDGERYHADEGSIRIDRITYDAGDRPCDTSRFSERIVFDSCTITLGTVVGSVAFTVEMDDGATLVQERVDFEVPLVREEIVATIVGQ